MHLLSWKNETIGACLSCRSQYNQYLQETLRTFCLAVCPSWLTPIAVSMVSAIVPIALRLGSSGKRFRSLKP